MKKISVLIVDDEDVVVLGIKKGLEENPLFTIRTAISCNKATQLCSEEQFDVALVDLIMPEINGVETCREIKKISPKTKVLLLSGFPSEVEKHQLEFVAAGGMDFFLRKPLLADEVAVAIIKIIKDEEE